MLDDDQLRRYHLSRENCLEILRYRGYDISDEYNMTREEFSDTYKDMDIQSMKEDMKNTFEKDFAVKGIKSRNRFGDSTVERTFITWHPESKLGVSVRDTSRYMEENNIYRAIIVVDDSVTSNCKDILKNIKITKNIIIDVWTLKESMVFVPKHVYVDPHRIISNKEKIDLMKKYGRDKSKYPAIPNDDIMVRYLGAFKGQFIEIMKVSDTNPDFQIPEFRYVK